MTVISTFSQKKREKQWKFERKVLRELKLVHVKKDIQEQFQSIVPFHFLTHPFLMDPCTDMAIDAYLLGAEYSRFGYFGETIEQVKKRCHDEVTELSHYVFDLLHGWYSESDFILDSLKIASEVFVDRWWERGFHEGEKRYRLRLH
ncbi:YbaK family protein [Halalkalibacterium ligniniphilum]|uniref:YbaK family protein n=1 Tax=Halalkalibacterium ligniniphilum TaxID=1134413 RepID=UPI00034D2E08|nr:YbaK family protein [Halalkalibacterium ligniniphilum]